MQLTSEEMLALQLRRRSFELVLADHRVQGALIACAGSRMPQLAVCPCCGYPTIWVRGQYDICSLCGWEDDDQDDATADEVWGGPNRDYSLTEARRNFIDSRTQYRPSDDAFLRAQQVAVERERVIEAYDALLPDVQPWSFIGEIRRIAELTEEFQERSYGSLIGTWRAADTEGARRADQWLLWSALKAGALPRQDWRPPNLDRKDERAFQATVRRVSDRIREQLGPTAPPVIDRGAGHRLWGAGDRSAELAIEDSNAVLTLEVAVDRSSYPLCSLADERTAEEIARRLTTFFGIDPTTSA